MTTCWCGGQAVNSRLGDPGELICLESRFHDPKATGVPEKIELLYLAGPMSGYEDCNYPAFNAAAAKLREAGFKVINPAEYESHGWERKHYVDLLREDLRNMLDCHGVAVLEGWWNSSGARNEVNVAGLLKMEVRSVPEWVTQAQILG